MTLWKPWKGLRSLSDQELVERALQDDERAHGELVRRHQEQVFALAHRMVDDWDIADSACHETFLRAFRALPHYKPEYSFSAWLSRIARNVALNRVNKRKLARLAIEGSAMMDTDRVMRNAPLQAPTQTDTPLEQLLLSERQHEILRAVAQLRPEYREAVLLFIEGLSYAEIAEGMDVPVGTVGTYLSRAREELRKALGTRSSQQP